eukprot:TRINITY_DN22205_c0_g1_i1.p1 TRINITY_DN22205_c0_g1~~TRINITY_DN22205_c0_g1_i1.p1  ORF type:complete len:699 (+),score=73.67 TRINITY_DN22205_c0_g1_i1:194-2290(+)
MLGSWLVSDSVTCSGADSLPPQHSEIVVAKAPVHGNISWRRRPRSCTPLPPHAFTSVTPTVGTCRLVPPQEAATVMGMHAEKTISPEGLTPGGLSPSVARKNRSTRAKLEELRLADEHVKRSGFISTGEHGEQSRAGRHLETLSASLQELENGLDTVRRNHSEFMDSQQQLSKAELPSVGPASRRKPQVSMQGKVVSRAQSNALKLFDDIDSRRTDKEAVFRAVPQASQRNELRLEFYRDRQELVLPPIEKTFMRWDESARVDMVDVKKVTDYAKERQTKIDSASDTDMCAPVCLLSPSHSVESLQQRAHRRAEKGELRERRIVSARDTQRRQLLIRRCAHLEELHFKANRRELANKHRSFFVYIALAIATEMFQRTIAGFRGLVELHALEDAEPFTLETLRPRRAIPNKALTRLNKFISRLRSSQVELQKRRAMISQWYLLTRAIMFIVRLMRKPRMHVYAETIKHFLMESWRGFRIHRAVGAYRGHIIILQRHSRAALKRRERLRAEVYLPALHEVETHILLEAYQAFHSKKQSVTSVDIATPSVTVEPKLNVHPTKNSGNDVGRSTQERKNLRKTLLVRTVTASDSFSVIIESLRLGQEQRHRIVHQLMRRNTDEWYGHYIEYMSSKEKLRQAWQRWFSALAEAHLGRELQTWPTEPPTLSFPESLADVNMELLNDMVLTALKQTNAMRILNAVC